MYRKRFIIFVLVVSMLLVLAGCSYAAYKDYYSDPTDYEEIWTLTGFRHGYDHVSTFFPQSLEGLDVKDFFCRYDQQLPLGEGVQVFLQIQYPDEKQLKAETQRIASMSFACDDYFEGTGFAAYATRLGKDYSSEYALIDQENRMIIYIFLYSLPKEEIELEPHLIPAGYTGYGEIQQPQVEK